MLGALLSISLGAADIHLRTVWDAIFHFQPTETSHQIIHDLRLPRTAAAALVGALLAVSGAIMQGMTRNPLAELRLWVLHRAPRLPFRLHLPFFPDFLLWGLCYGPLQERGWGHRR